MESKNYMLKKIYETKIINLNMENDIVAIKQKLLRIKEMIKDNKEFIKKKQQEINDLKKGENYGK